MTTAENVRADAEGFKTAECGQRRRIKVGAWRCFCKTLFKVREIRCRWSEHIEDVLGLDLLLETKTLPIMDREMNRLEIQRVLEQVAENRKVRAFRREFKRAIGKTEFFQAPESWYKGFEVSVRASSDLMMLK